tara:strand:- start:1601 stop:2365 length:765 start_codon:yes stop_codon:yes gene_type:complete
MRFCVIIPARIASTRLKNKPLAKIHGSPMIAHVVKAASQSDADAVFVTTDDNKISEIANTFDGVSVIMTKYASNGTHRVMTAYNEINDEFDVVVNLQCDEPFIDPNDINKVAKLAYVKKEIATITSPLFTKRDLLDRNCVKTFVGESELEELPGRNTILMFTRSPLYNYLPYTVYPRVYTDFINWRKHIGVYAFHSSVVPKVRRLCLTNTDNPESLEQQIWLECGLNIHPLLTYKDYIGIDTPEDLHHVNKSNI